MAERVGYGLVGTGSFGQYCLEQYSKMDEVKIVAVADRTPERGREVAAKYGVEAYESLEQMLQRDDVQIVHIATPPAMHRDHVIAALDAGRHVLCEKPLATRASDAKAMLDAAAKAERVLVINLIMRYNPLTQAVKKIVAENLLGEPIHAFLENYATDEPLAPDHWFWDRDRSGGIFIEHGVHFFDLYETWFGPGEVLEAAQMTRPGNANIVDQVQCFCRYGDSVFTSFYHGFHQASRMDRQEFRIVCERGDMRLFEWLPTSIRIDAMLRESDVERISLHLPHARVRQVNRYSGDQRKVTSRHKRYEVDGLYTIEADAGMKKDELYGKVLRDLLGDQVRRILDPSHQRVLDERAGLTTTTMAEQATRLLGEKPPPAIEPAMK